MIVSGWSYSEPKFIVGGGRAWVIPCLQRADFLPMNVFQVSITTLNVPTVNGSKITVRGTAQVKINNDEASLKQAAQNFMNTSIEEIQTIATETMEGHQRSILGKMTIEEILQDKTTFSQQVFEIAQVDLMKMGLFIISYTMKEVTDSNGYLQAYGAGQVADVKKEERIKVAEAKTRSDIETYHAKQAKEESRLLNLEAAALKQRDFDLRTANNKTEIERAKAIQNAAEKIRTAQKMLDVTEQKMKVKVIERERQIELQESEIKRKEKQLEATVKKPAEAQKLRLEIEAEADLQRSILEAEAKAESTRLKGESHAYAIEVKAKAEAENMKRRAKALDEYQKAAMTNMIVQKLPEIISEITKPLMQTNSINLVSSGASDLGASKLTNEVLSILNTLPKTVHSMTGVDISKTESSPLLS